MDMFLGSAKESWGVAAALVDVPAEEAVRFLATAARCTSWRIPRAATAKRSRAASASSATSSTRGPSSR